MLQYSSITGYSYKKIIFQNQMKAMSQCPHTHTPYTALSTRGGNTENESCCTVPWPCSIGIHHCHGLKEMQQAVVKVCLMLTMFEMAQFQDRPVSHTRLFFWCFVLLLWMHPQLMPCLPGVVVIHFRSQSTALPMGTTNERVPIQIVHLIML